MRQVRWQDATTQGFRRGALPVDRADDMTGALAAR